LDRREWAWVAVPGLAVLVSGGIYLFGASGRGSTLSQALTITELNGQGQALESTAAAVFVPKGGTYTVSAKGNYKASPLASGNNYGPGNELKGESDIYVRSGAEASDIRYEGVPFWSVSKAWYYGQAAQQTGGISYSLAMDAGSWKGEFKSSLKTDLKDAYFYIGNQWFALGDLKAGGSAAIDPQKGQTFGQPVHAVHQLFSYQGHNDTNAHKRALLMAYLDKRQENGDTPMILGWSQETVSSKLAVNGSSVATDELRLWVQQVQPNVVLGNTAYVPLGMVKPVVQSSTLKFSPADPNGNMHVNQGEAELIYKLPELPKVDFTKFAEVAIYAVNQQDRYEIWNHKTGQYEPLEQVKPGSELADYRVEGGGTVRLKLTMKQEGLTRFPDFAFEGRVRP